MHGYVSDKFKKAWPGYISYIPWSLRSGFMLLYICTVFKINKLNKKKRK